MTYRQMLKKLPEITVSPEVLERKLKDYGFTEQQIDDAFVALGWARIEKVKKHE